MSSLVNKAIQNMDFSNSTKLMDRSALEAAIISSNLPIVTPETFIADIIALLSHASSSCPLPILNQVPSGIEVPSFQNGDIQVGCVLIMEETHLVGLLTERDIVRFVASGLNLEGITAADVMAPHLITLRYSDFRDVLTVVNLFREHRIRHLPILTDDGQLLGIITPDTIRQSLEPIDLLRLLRVAEVMSTEVIHAKPSASVLELAQLVAKHQVSCVVITEETRDNKFLPIGIVTERDIVQFQALELDFAAIQARTVMSSPLFCLSPEDSVWAAHQQMLSRHVQRLVVSDRQGHLLGIITQTSILRSLNPSELSVTVQMLQQKVCKLEFEKVEILENRNHELEKQVQERTDKLQQLNQQLECRVQERTANLNRINEQLKQEIFERQLAEAELRKAKDKLQSILDAVEAATDGIAILNQNCEHVYLNKAYLQLFGYGSVDDLIGKTWKDLYCQKEIKRIEDDIFPLLRQKGNWQGEAIGKRRDDSSFAKEVSLTITEDGSVICVCRDITQRKQAENKLYQALEKEKELNQMKSRFVSMTSHEFRVPLSSIMGANELLKYYGHKWDENQKLTYFNCINNAVKRMAQMLDDVLLLGKVEAGKLDFNPVLLNVVNLCTSIVEEFNLDESSEHIIIFKTYGDCTDVHIDEKLIRHILNNLLSNAIKYSPINKEVFFLLILQEKEITFKIQDKGIGIPKEDQKHLFEGFYRANNVGKISGTGLGLAIVKKTVELHNGEIIVKSEVGCGTTVTVSIPIDS